ncbi:DUF1761 domain-containing protein [Sphingomonas sp. SUN039]|uniref:DUF1761 domain-containing protein n=1 Tax=Sphingomonas sp. SUN039 TaxID=2937787 RepID=UPI0021646486|nr:DUF1761 domain-containing protein [Sphingomonas sp. SUN039]UVO53424.1 DUF1761 domain-containing protein [Sphingomonas sp. SUN039]
MIYIWINILPIIVAALASVALAGLIYGRKAAPATLAVVFLAQAWLAAILAGALILAPPKGGLWTMTIGSAVVIWAGFVAPTLTASYRLRGQSWRTIGVDGGYWLAAMVLQAIIMRLIGLVPPPV